MPTEQPQPPEKLSGLYTALASGKLVPSAISNIPDARYRAETQDLESQRLQTELSGIKLDIEQRKTYAERIFRLVVCWLAAIGLVIFVQGFHLLGFSLDASVLLLLIGSTTSGVVGLFLIVTRYIFPARTAESAILGKSRNVSAKTIRPKQNVAKKPKPEIG